VNRHFQGQTREIEIHAYYQNYCIDSNHILHSDKDHQMPFAGGPPNVHITNPRWRTAAILKKSKNRHISATVGPIATKFGRLTQFDPLDHSVSKIGPYAVVALFDWFMRLMSRVHFQKQKPACQVSS